MRSVLMIGVLALLFAASCSGDDQSGGGNDGRSDAGAAGGTEAHASGDTSEDPESVTTENPGKQTPLLMRVLQPPDPVRGSDGKLHLVYELELTNTSPGTATVQSVETIDPSSGEVVGTVAGDDIASRTALLGDISGATSQKIGSGQVAIAFLDVTFEDPGDIPEAIEHRLKASFKIPAAFGSNLFPTETTDTGGPTKVLRGEPIVLGPPLEGANWVATNGCCTISPHRGAMLALGGRLLATERYAIDWIQSDDEGGIVLPDGSQKLDDFPAYGERVISVADGEVAKVVDGMRDVPPGVLDPNNTLMEAGGNHVILNIGDGRYALYAHLQPGSIKVEEGDRVTRGQQLALLGNSGNTTAPHLHFHVMDAPLELGADANLPYVFDAFDYQGFLDAADGTPNLLNSPKARADELPMAFSVVTFPAPQGN